jgi:hypothetical protein
LVKAGLLEIKFLLICKSTLKYKVMSTFANNHFQMAPQSSLSGHFSPVQQLARRPAKYVALVCLTMLLGLASRRYGHWLPWWAAAYAGDALWALLVFWLVGLGRPRWRSRGVASAAWCFAIAIEISQLYHAPWLNALRHTTLGSLVLGQGFLWSDIGCYTVGVLAGYALERSWLRSRVG